VQYFDRYVSNTVAGSANQLFFTPADPCERCVGRVYYRVHASGEFNYSFLYSNVTDSTFDHGDVSRANRVLAPWTLHALRVGVTSSADPATLGRECMFSVTFGGKTEKTVQPGEFFESDPIRLSANAGEYVCLEYVFSGREIPYHEERIIPTFRYLNGVWTDSAHVPFLGMLGCERNVKARVCFWGDSITQGIGTERDSYTHWNAQLARTLGTDYSYWNLGIGYGRATDAASLGAWFYKAKHADLCVVCFGVNDILQTGNADLIKESLTLIVQNLKALGIAVVLQTVPPFDYNAVQRTVWENVNAYIKNSLGNLADAVFDTVTVLGTEHAPHMARYGGHPNADGCALWARALAPVVKSVLEHVKKN